MRLDQNPLFRKVIVPWYDSETVCYIVIFLMFLSLLLGIAGIYVAWETAEFRRYIWLPGLLAALSVCVLITTTIRLVKRYLYRFSK